MRVSNVITYLFSVHVGHAHHLPYFTAHLNSHSPVSSTAPKRSFSLTLNKPNLWGCSFSVINLLAPAPKNRAAAPRVWCASLARFPLLSNRVQRVKAHLLGNYYNEVKTDVEKKYISSVLWKKKKLN